MQQYEAYSAAPFSPFPAAAANPNRGKLDWAQSVQADFAGGSLTSDAGALLVREADRFLSLYSACRGKWYPEGLPPRAWRSLSRMASALEDLKDALRRR